MTDEEKKLFQDTVEKLDKFLEIYNRTHFIDRDVFMNKVTFKNDVYMPVKTAFFAKTTPVARQTAITPPAGGVTVDSEARSAINDIITKLQALNLTA